MMAAALTKIERSAFAGASVAMLERAVGAEVISLAQHMIAVAFATACRAAMLADLRERGVRFGQVRLRTDEDGYATVHTTFGPITFPTFAYYDLSTPAASVTRRPAEKLFPFHQACRSSPLCLEWEARLGAQHPFRKAEELFHFFTRGVSTVEDTTISRHMLALSDMVEPSWLYKQPEDIRAALRNKATRDRTTNRPLIYMSTDAHALRRYVGNGWVKNWKMVNGIRIWCEDATTGKIIHLGGEFTWGDCREVGVRVQALITAGVLPNGDEAWTALNAQLVFISDGVEWLTEHVLPLLVGAEIILDPYHLMDWFATFGREVFRVGSKESRQLHAAVRLALFGKRPEPSRPEADRRGHKKRSGVRLAHAYDRRWLQRGRPRIVSTEATTEALLDILAGLTLRSAKHEAAREALVEKLAKNALRTDYAVHLARGLQIGSGPMESMHRTGSQLRLKVPGASWLEETSTAVLRFRMLELSGRWDEFWRQHEIAGKISAAFKSGRRNVLS